MSERLCSRCDKTFEAFDAYEGDICEDCFFELENPEDATDVPDEEVYGDQDPPHWVQRDDEPCDWIEWADKGDQDETA